MANKGKLFERKWQIGGWLLFILSALLYIAASFKAGDLISLAGSFFFLVACFVFLVPFFFSGRS